MKIAVSGSTGKIGSRLVALGCEPLKIDLLNPETIQPELNRVQPDVVVHAAGVSSIDKCQSNYEEAIAINVWGTNKLCELAGDGKVVLLSSEQVFDGKTGNYLEQDEPNPINNYGLTKLAAEGVTALYGGKVIRLSRGIEETCRDIATPLTWLMAGKDVEIPDFIYRSYSHLDFIAEAIFEYAKRFKEMPEVLNIGGLEVVSFYRLIDRLSKAIDAKGCVKPREVGDDKESPRPYRCGLDVSLAKYLGLPLYTMQQTINRMTREVYERL